MSAAAPADNLQHQVRELRRLYRVELDRDKLACEQSLRRYVGGAWRIIEPSRRFVPNWHIDLMCEYLEAVSRFDITRLVINVPPRMMKSIACTVSFPTWVWTRWPEARFLFGAYAGSLSTKHSMDRRTIMSSEWYQGRWGDRVAFTKDQNQKTEYQNTKRGVMVATSVGGTATGKGGDFVIIDDPLNPEQAYSDLDRERANRWFDQTISTRLDDPKRGAIVIVMQRLHEKDLVGHVAEFEEETGEKFEIVRLPMQAEAKATVVFPSGREVKREKDGLLFPERFGERSVAGAKRRLGEYGYAAQYQQRPAPLGGGMFKTAWWQRWRAIPNSMEFWYTSWDFTFDDTKDSDYVVGQVWGLLGADKYLVDQVRSQADFIKARAMMVALSDKWKKATAHVVEGKANGPAIISELKSKVSGIIPWPPKGYKMESKVARAAAASPDVEAGNVYIPERAPWISDFLAEFDSFPKAANDDQVDALSQAIAYARVRPAEGGAGLEWFEEQHRQVLESLGTKPDENDEDEDDDA